MVHNTLAQVFPEDGIVVLESPSSTLSLRNQMRMSRPGSYYFGAGGGLGFGLAAAIGVQLAQPDRPVVCVLGEGSAQYAITGFWTAAAYDVPVTFLVLRNEEYSILKWFAGIEEVTGAPGLDLPALEVATVAEAYGVSSQAVSGRDQLHEALEEAIGSGAPKLVEVPVAPAWLCSDHRVRREILDGRCRRRAVERNGIGGSPVRCTRLSAPWRSRPTSTGLADHLPTGDPAGPINLTAERKGVPMESSEQDRQWNPRGQRATTKLDRAGDQNAGVVSIASCRNDPHDRGPH